MITSLICLFIAIFARIGVEKLEFMIPYIHYFNWVIVITAVVFVLMVVITIIKKIKK